MPDFELIMLGIGHGDAFLLKAPGFTALVDGGQHPGRLHDGLRRNAVSHLNLLIATHVDADHMGGLEALAAFCPVDTFWAPCLPAFERHAWLFAPRVQDAVSRARAVEDSLIQGGCDVIYPLEGFASQPVPGLTLEILSPPARLIETLLTASEIGFLLSQVPMPMGWLLEPVPPVLEQDQASRLLAERLVRGYLRPGEIPRFPPAANPTADLRVADPEFFGDSILNNTSIVAWAETGPPPRRSVLLTGDLENWAYLLARHPRGLHADLLKAPHHGGQTYINSRPANEEVLSSVRPRALLVSANGKHKLPHADLRMSAARWGASVFCTSQRGRELVLGQGTGAGCCHDLYQCSSQTRDVRLAFDAGSLTADAPACHSGLGAEPGPVIHIAQHHIDPSPVLGKLFEQELLKHVDWLEKKLRAIHQERSAAPPAKGQPVDGELLASIARADGRFLLVANLGEVLARGAASGRFWLSADRYRPAAYCLPKPADLAAFLDAVRALEALVFANRKPLPALDRLTVAASLRRDELADLCETVTRFPATVFEAAFWPSLMRELTGEWHCWVHRNSGLVFARHSDTAQLSRRLYELNYAPDPFTGGRRWKRWPAKNMLASESGGSYREWPDSWLGASQFQSEEWPAIAVELEANLTRLW